MKSNDKLVTATETFQEKIVEEKKNERANILKDVKYLYKDIRFTSEILKDSLAERFTKR